MGLGDRRGLSRDRDTPCCCPERGGGKLPVAAAWEPEGHLRPSPWADLGLQHQDVTIAIPRGEPERLWKGGAVGPPGWCQAPRPWPGEQTEVAVRGGRHQRGELLKGFTTQNSASSSSDSIVPQLMGHLSNTPVPPKLLEAGVREPAPCSLPTHRVQSQED